MTNTKLILPEEAAMGWYLYGPMLQQSVDHGQQETSITQYLQRILSYQAQLWEFSDSADGSLLGVGLTQFLQYSNHKTLHIVACTGSDWNLWKHCYYSVEQFAKDNQCAAVETWGRAGWSKLLPKEIPGFFTAYHVMRKNINYEDQV